MSSPHKLSILKICMISATAITINIGFSVIASYGLPLVLATGLTIRYAPLIFSVSSVASFLMQGCLGTSSDHCTCQWGKRRPFIVTFSTLTALGLLISCFSFYFKSTIIITISVCIGMIISDFSVGVLQLPSRAYLLDSISTSQAELANFIYSALYGIGTILGALLGAMKWSLLTHQPVTIQHQAQFVYSIASVVVIVCTVVTICAVKERRQLYRDRISEEREGGEGEGEGEEGEGEGEGDGEGEGEGEGDSDDVQSDDQKNHNCAEEENTSFSNDSFNGDYDKQKLIKHKVETLPVTTSPDDTTATCNGSNYMKRFVNSFIDIFRFLPKMSIHMWLLWVMVFFSLQGIAFFNGYVTLYVGTVVYQGDPHANHSTDSYQRYVTGVHTGTWALFLAAVTDTIASLTLNLIIKFISLKTIFLVSTALYCVGVCLLIYFHQLALVFTVGAIFGVYFGLTLTVPYILIPIYKERKLLFRKGKSIEGESVEGRACAVINTSVFLSLLILSLVTGPLLDAANDNSYVMLFACISSSLTFFSALVVKMPPSGVKKKKEKKEETGELIKMSDLIQNENSISDFEDISDSEDTRYINFCVSFIIILYIITLLFILLVIIYYHWSLYMP